MIKYIKVEWPDAQLYQEHSRYNECYNVMTLKGADIPILMVPEDLYEEIEINKLYPAKVDSTLGKMVITHDDVTINETDKYTRDYNQLKRGSKVILYSPEKGYWITKCVAYSFNMPPLFEDNSTLIECEIIGIKND